MHLRFYIFSLMFFNKFGMGVDPNIKINHTMTERERELSGNAFNDLFSIHSTLVVWRLPPLHLHCSIVYFFGFATESLRISSLLHRALIECKFFYLFDLFQCLEFFFRAIIAIIVRLYLSIKNSHED